MKHRNFFMALVALVALGVSACNGGSVSGQDVKIENQSDSVSYALGHSVGNNLKTQFPTADPQIIAQALIEAFA